MGTTTYYFQAQGEEVEAISSEYYSQVRTRTLIEPPYIYDQNYKVQSVPLELKMDFSRILNKPYFIKNVKWTTSEISGDILDTVKIPMDLFNNPLSLIPFSASTLFRAKIALMLQVSGTSMHMGCLLAGALPNGMGIDTKFRQLTNTLMCSPHAFLNANEQTSIELRIPFYVNSHLMRTDLDKSTASFEFNGVNYAEVPLMVLNPLACPANSNTTLTVSIYAIFQEAEFYAPHTDVTFVAQGFVDDLSSIGTRFIDGLFSTVRKTTGDILDAGRRGIKTLTGLHNPNKPNLDLKNYVQSRNVSNTTDHSTKFEKMDNFANYDRILSDYIFETAYDEMDIKNLGKKPQYLGTCKVSSSDSAGILLWSRPITPNQGYFNFTSREELPPEIKTLAFCNLQQVLAYVHKYWRGSINIHIQSVMSNFHFCKLAVARDYSVRVQSYSAYPSFESIPNLMTEVLEFSAGGQVQTITMPFVSQLNQLPVSLDFFNNSDQHGMYYIYLNQPLVSNGTVPKDVYFNIFISLGDDFEFYGYSNDPILVSPLGEVRNTPTTFEAQASLEVPVNDQEELHLDTKENLRHCAIDLRPVTHVRDHIRRFYKVLKRAILYDEFNTSNGTFVFPINELLGQAPLLETGSFPSAYNAEYKSTLDLFASMFYGCNGGGRFKVVVTGATDASMWYVPPSYYSQLLETQAGFDVTTVSCYPTLETYDPSINIEQHELYDNLTLDFDRPIKYSVQSPFIERANFNTSGPTQHVSRDYRRRIMDSTSILEVEVPNISPYKFLGDITKTATTSFSTGGVSQSSGCCNMGYLVLSLRQPSPINLTENILRDYSINVTIYAAYDDAARFGYQVYCPTVIIPAVPNTDPLFPYPISITTQNFSIPNVSPQISAPIPMLPQPAGVLKWSYYTRT